MQCGVKVWDMSVEDIRITNVELQSAMARGAVKQTELEMANIDRRVREMQATTASRANIIEAEGQARAIDIMAKVRAEGRMRRMTDDTDDDDDDGGGGVSSVAVSAVLGLFVCSECTHVYDPHHRLTYRHHHLYVHVYILYTLGRSRSHPRSGRGLGRRLPHLAAARAGERHRHRAGEVSVVGACVGAVLLLRLCLLLLFLSFFLLVRSRLGNVARA